MIDLKHIRRTAALVAVAVIAASCSASDDSDSSSDETGSQDTAAGEGGTDTSGSDGGGEASVDPDGVLRAGYDLETQLTNLDPSISNNTCDRNIWTYILDSLLRTDEDGNLAPGLAEDWSIDDPNTITLTLREGLTYHDGTPMTAETVMEGIEYNDNNENLEPLDNIASMEVVDDVTLRITLEDPTPLELLYAFTAQAGMLVAPSSFGSADSMPIGAGPFVFDSYQPGSRLTMSKFDDHWEADEYLVGGLEYVQTTSVGPETVTAYQSGDVELIKFLAESLPTVESTENTGVAERATNEYIQLEFRLRNSQTGEETPFADPNVRKAVSTAINREEINTVVENGTAVVTNQAYPPGSPFHVDELSDLYAYDVEAARALLAESAYPDGFEFDMVIPGGGLVGQERGAELIQSQLAEIGITANIVSMLPQDIANDYYLRKTGDAFSAHELPTTFPPDVFFNSFGNFQFVAIHDGAERDDIYDLAQEAYAATSEEQVAEITREMARISTENALDVPIANTKWFAAWNTDRVGGTPGAPADACTPWDLKGVYMIG